MIFELISGADVLHPRGAARGTKENLRSRCLLCGVAENRRICADEATQPHHTATTTFVALLRTVTVFYPQMDHIPSATTHKRNYYAKLYVQVHYTKLLFGRSLPKQNRTKTGFDYDRSRPKHVPLEGKRARE